jgi:hypothetical protein
LLTTVAYMGSLLFGKPFLHLFSNSHKC